MEVTKPNDPQCSDHFHMLGEKERGSFNSSYQYSEAIIEFSKATTLIRLSRHDRI